MFGLGVGEIVLLGILALIFLGPKKLPEMAMSFGKAIREFQKAKNEMMSSIQDNVHQNQNHIQNHIQVQNQNPIVELKKEETTKEEIKKEEEPSAKV
jgi:sec-independent protein translocase protein TatA